MNWNFPLWELFKHAGWVAWPLGLCAVLALGIILERLFTLNKLKAAEEGAFEALRTALEKGEEIPRNRPDVAGAPSMQIMETLVVLRGATEDAIQQAAEIALSLQRL